jgi:hypothetical protein
MLIGIDYICVVMVKSSKVASKRWTSPAATSPPGPFLSYFYVDKMEVEVVGVLSKRHRFSCSRQFILGTQGS